MNGLLLYYQSMRIKSPSGQVATLFIVLIAVIFIFMAVTLNLGRISSNKTALDNAADGAALMLASNLGSFSYVNSLQQGCSFDLMAALGAFLGLMVFFANPVLGLVMIGGSYAREQIGNYFQTKGFRKISTLSNESQIKESGIYYALSALVEDPTMVIDTRDLDEDGIYGFDPATGITDLIPAFVDWYDQRLTALDTGVDPETGINIGAIKGSFDTLEKFLVGDDQASCAGARPNNIGFLGDIDGKANNEVCPPTADFTNYFQNDFITMLRNLRALYTADNLNYAVVDTQINFWRDRPADLSQPDCGANPQTAQTDPDYFKNHPDCDNVDALNYELTHLSSAVLVPVKKSVDSGYSLWTHATITLGLFFADQATQVPLNITACPEGLNSPQCSWRKLMENWKAWAIDWRARLNTVLNADNPTISAGLGTPWPLFPSQDYCHLNACDGACNTMASDPMINCNTITVTLPVNYPQICAACKNLFFNTWQNCQTGCGNTFIRSMTIAQLNCVICPCYLGCPWIGSCCQRAGYSCVVCINNTLAGQGLCWSECSQPGPCAPGTEGVSCFQVAQQPAYDNCMSGCLTDYSNNFSGCCISRCMNECYKPVREDIVRSIAMLDAFNSRINRLTQLLDAAQKKYNEPGSGANQVFTHDRNATYGWKDEQGWHIVKARVSGVKLPKMDYHSEAWGFTDCADVLCPTGSVATWVWRYDQSRDTKFIGRGNVPLWNFRYGRNPDVAVTKPNFFVTRNNWFELSGAERQQAEQFVEDYGLRAYARAGYGPAQPDIRIIATGWTDTQPPICLDY